MRHAALLVAAALASPAPCDGGTLPPMPKDVIPVVAASSDQVAITALGVGEWTNRRVHAWLEDGRPIQYVLLHACGRLVENANGTERYPSFSMPIPPDRVLPGATPPDVHDPGPSSLILDLELDEIGRDTPLMVGGGVFDPTGLRRTTEMGCFAWLHVRFDAADVKPGTQVLVRVETRAMDAPLVTVPDWSFTATLAVVHGSGAPPPPAQR